MQIIDISRTLDRSIAVWPGDTAFSLRTTLAMDSGAAVNLTTVTMSGHTGTHVDAPRHFQDDGARIAELDLAPFWGPAQVITVARGEGPLVPADFAHVDLKLASRVLIHSASSHQDPTQFDRRIVYPSPELADHLGRLGICLFGTDAPSVDRVDSKGLPGHRALLHNGIAILEGLDLSQTPDGLYELVALPLRIAGGDGSPVRAALRTWEAP